MSGTPSDSTPNDLLCDLHLHSTNSDGLASPEEVVELARHASLWAMCISDHSRVTFDPELVELAAEHGLIMLPGMEISTLHDGRKYHVLAYGRGVFDAHLQEVAFRPTAIKNDTYRQVLADLRAEGARLPGDEEILMGVRDDAPPLHPGKWMFSSTLIGRYLARHRGMGAADAAVLVKDRYNALKGRESDRYVSTEETVAMVRAAGAIPVIAHPFWECTSGRNSWDGVVRDLRHFRDLGLVGVEVSSRHDSPAAEERRRVVADELDLVPFRSSDFHANGKTKVGQFPMPFDALTEAAERCGAELPIPARNVRSFRSE
jgi:predicted metal-dependent phosphoesterase TrpH